MRLLLLFVIYAFITFSAQAQSLSVSESSATRNNTTGEYLVAGHTLAIQGKSLSFGGTSVSSDVNDVTALSAVLNASGVALHAGNGQKLFTSNYKLHGGDSSIKIYVKPNGGYIIRENIANFLFYDANGKIEQSVSNSSQSTEGEAISELAADPTFKTVVLYNPKIVRNGKEGASAQILKQSWTTNTFFYSEDRAIRSVKVSGNGQWIAVISYKEGTDDAVEITDRFGNSMNTFHFNQQIADVRFSENGQYITIRSGSRVGVYNMLRGDRVGSTSFRSRLRFAQFVPEDETVIALTADVSGSLLSNVEVHAINLKARTIERQAYNATLGETDLLSLNLKRTGSSRYTLSGLSKALNLKVSF